MVLSPAEYKRLDVCMLTLIRKLMKGDATTKTMIEGGIKYRSVSAQELWRWVGLAPAAI